MIKRIAGKPLEEELAPTLASIEAGARTMADIVESLTKLRARTSRETGEDVEESLARETSPWTSTMAGPGIRETLTTRLRRKEARRQALLDREVKRMSKHLKRRLRKRGITLTGVECRLSVLEK